MTLEIITSDALSELRHGFFTRKGGVSSGIFEGLNCGVGSSDQAEAVRLNRARVAEATAVEFEAAMLTSFIEPMLPSEESPVWGGTGASAWRGLFAQEVAAELARAGGIGLAEVVSPALMERATVEPALNTDGKTS